MSARFVESVEGIKVKHLRRAVHLSTLAGVLLMGFSGTELLTALLVFALSGKVGVELGYHRCLSHRAFDLSLWTRRLVLTLGALTVRGSPLSWAIVHRQHHAEADTAGDPHSGFHHPGWTPKHLRIEKKYGASLSLVKDPWLRFLHRHYNLLIIGLFVSILLLNPKLYFIGLAFPVLLTSFSNFLTNTVCHRWGYRNFSTADRSTNNLLVQILTLGGGLHNNHHAMPGAINQGVRWFEIDYFYFVTRLIMWIDRALFPSRAERT